MTKGDTRPTDIDKYLETVPEPAYTALSKIRAIIRSVVPAEATEAISYGIPTFKYKGNLLAFAAFKKHCSLFPMSYAVIDAFRDKPRTTKYRKAPFASPWTNLHQRLW